MAKLIGNKPNQVPTNADLGDLAYQDKGSVKIEGGEITADSLEVIGGLSQTTTTVAALPTASSNTGVRYMVSDSTVAASGNFGATVAGSGSNVVPVFSDGTNWVIG